MRSEKKIRKWLLGAVGMAGMCSMVMFGAASAQAKTLYADTDGDRTTASIQSCLDEAAEGDGQYVVKVPKGTYTVASCLRIYSNTTLDLGGSTLRLSGHPEGGYMMQIGRPNYEPNGGYSKGKYSRGKHIKIMNGTLDAGKACNEMGDMFSFSHAEDITVRNVTFRANPSKEPKYHMVECAAVRNVRFTGCRFLGNQHCKSAFQIESAIKGVASMNSQGPTDGTKTLHVKLSGCTFSNLQYAFGTNHASSRDVFRNIRVSGCTFRRITKYAVCAYNYKNCRISGNHLKGCRSGNMRAMLLLQGSNGITVR